MAFILNYKRWKALHEQETFSTQEEITPAQILAGEKALTLGSSGETVKTIQQKLKDDGYFSKEPNGEYDEDTYNAVKEFQAHLKDSQGNALVQDGIVGTKTIAALFDLEEPTSSKTRETISVVSPQMTKYEDIVALVIDKLEGGYYHPDMLKDGRIKDSRYSASGETMMGIDRKAGGKLNDTPAGIEFWKLIDDSNARTNWNWLYRGGDLEPKLRELTGQIIKPQFEKLVDLYLTPEATALVNSDGRLLFHFIYATWNGSGWFKKFATDINAAVSRGIKDTNQLLQVALDSRTKEGLSPGSPPNPLVAQGGEKIKKLVGFDTV